MPQDKGPLVFTIDGLIPLSDLQIVDTVELGDNYRKIITTFRHGDRIVRQSAAIEALRPIEGGLSQGSSNG